MDECVAATQAGQQRQGGGRWVEASKVQGPSQAWKYGITHPDPDGSFHGNLREKDHPLRGPSVPLFLSGSPEHHFRKKEQAKSEVH